MCVKKKHKKTKKTQTTSYSCGFEDKNILAERIFFCIKFYEAHSIFQILLCLIIILEKAFFTKTQLLSYMTIKNGDTIKKKKIIFFNISNEFRIFVCQK